MNKKSQKLPIKPLAILFLVIAFQLITSFVFAQNGTIRGAIFDESTGEPLYGVSVLVKETSTGAVTDFDGKFEVQVAPGSYTLQISYISFATVNLTEVLVEDGKVTVLSDVLMKTEESELETVTVSAAAIRTTESALMSVKRNAPNLLDGISASTFRQIGDGDAASAVRRVTGVSIEGGKYVYVRGLGDRYTKTILNGVDIPGLDPDRNTIQMDIFPTNVIDNIVVSKSFTAELPADFTGGVVDIETKDFPEEKSFRLSLSGGVNPSMHFNKNYLTYQGGKTDWLGYDDGIRKSPTAGRTDIPQFANVIGNPNGAKGQEYQSLLRAFNKTLGPTTQPSFMDYGLSLSFGNQIARPKVTWGYNAALTYKNDTEFYQNARFNLFAKPIDANKNELEALQIQKGDYGVNSVLLGGLAGIAMKTKSSKLKLNFLHLQNGESKSGIFDYESSNLGANFQAKQYNLEYSQRALTSVLLSGNHFINGKAWEINWKLAPTRSSIEDPDIRFTRFRVPNNTIGPEVGLPARIWRNLQENNLVGKLDLTKNMSLWNQDAKLKFGGSYTFKERNFEIQSFAFATGTTPLDGNPNSVLQESNLFSSTNRNGVRFNPDFIPNNPNSFQSSLTNLGGYVSAEANPLPNLKAILGLRVEKYTQFYTGTNQNSTIIFNEEKVLDDLNFFPTLNLVVNVKEAQNLRFSVARTIARPSFKELSFAEIIDPISGRTFVGGLFKETTNGGTEVLWDGNLVSTNINNFDVRWEMFQPKGEMWSVGVFYKTFEKPIEIVQFISDGGSFQPRNVGNGTVLGMELEFRKSLKFISPSLEKFQWNTNLTLTQSQITMSATEKKSRQLTAREGQVIGTTRDMAGQAPYIINTGIAYSDYTTGWEAGVYYNVQGPTLNMVGFGNRTDTYAVPFNSLNVNINKTFGADERIRASFGVQNLLNDKREFIYSSYGAKDQFFTQLSPGVRANFSLSFSF